MQEESGRVQEKGAAGSRAPADVSWLIGGPQGSGVESGANIFSRVCAGMGYHVFGKREFYSNIKGEHSYFVVRVADRPVASNVDRVDVMTSFDAETIFRHYDEVGAGGAIIYDSGLEDTADDGVATLDAGFRKRLRAAAAAAGGGGEPVTVRSVLEAARRRGVVLHPVPFRRMLADMAEEAGDARLRGMVRMFNVMGVSLSCGLMGLPADRLLAAVGRVFAAKPAIAELNQTAARHSYDLAVREFAGAGGGGPETAASPPSTTGRLGGGRGGGAKDTILAQGHEGTSIGKMVAGCRFQSYYPITPASDESVYLEAHELLDVADGDGPVEKGGGGGCTIVTQTEDEISAVGMMIGGALTGARSSTSTSGPGFALMAEALGWAGINEVPVVVTLYQRSGPSTGLPTRHGQDDLLFAVHAGHGEFPRIVYASGDVEESFYDTARCFNYADVFQLPVIHMMDKFISSSVVTCRRFDPSRVRIDRGDVVWGQDGGGPDDGSNSNSNNSGGVAYKRFALTGNGISPRARLGGDGTIFWNTGDESDEYGHVTEDPVLRVQMMDKRMSRLDLALEGIPAEEQAVSHSTGDITVVSWGSAKGPVADAVRMMAEEDGVRVGFVQIKLLHPFPAGLVSSMLAGAGTVVDVEANHTGQLGKLLRQNTGREPDHYILKYTGRAMTSTEVCGALRRVVRGDAKKREVLTRGA